jgi:hypothetical protein
VVDFLPMGTPPLVPARRLGRPLGHGECGVQAAAHTGNPGVDGLAAIPDLVQHLGVAGGKRDLQPGAAGHIGQVQDRVDKLRPGARRDMPSLDPQLRIDQVRVGLDDGLGKETATSLSDVSSTNSPERPPTGVSAGTASARSVSHADPSPDTELTLKPTDPALLGQGQGSPGRPLPSLVPMASK